MMWRAERWALMTMLLAAARALAAAAPEHPPLHLEMPLEPPPEHRSKEDHSERSDAVRRAIEEIRRDPSQKKFILFRHGLREEDLR